MHFILTSPVQSCGRFFTRGNVRGYCFGFNGQMKDDELHGEGNAYAFEYRIHDARLGRFLSVDPIASSFPWNSTYAFAENDVIRAIDLEGREKLNAADGSVLIFDPSTGQIQKRIPIRDVLMGRFSADDAKNAIRQIALEGGLGLRVTMEFKTSQGNSVYVDYPLYDVGGSNMEVKFDVPYQNPVFDKNGILTSTETTGSNCYGFAFGTYGLFQAGIEQLLGDNYTKSGDKVQDAKTGDVVMVYSKKMGIDIHVFEVAGENESGEKIYNSVWLAGGEIIGGTYKDIVSQMDYEGWELDEVRFEVYTPKETENKSK